MDDKQDCVYMNEAAEGMTGFTLDELKGKQLHYYVHHKHPDGSTYPLEECPIDQALPTHSRMKGEEMFVHKDGSFYPVAFTASPIIVKGKAIGTVIEVRDTTEEKQKERELKESEQRFRALADESPMFVFIIDPDPLAPVSYWNKTWLEYTGQTFEEAKGTAWDGIIHPDDVPGVMAVYVPAFEKQQPYVLPAIRVKRHDGEYRYHMVKSNPRYLPNGDFNGYVGVGFDVHEQKTTEERLEVLVAERTKELQRSNDDLQQFAHVASHDLKEPVRKIKTFTGRLEQHLNGILDETGSRFIERIQVATDRMFNMIDGVLTYSTTNAGDQRPEVVDLTEVVRNIETDLEVALQTTAATLQYKVLPTLEGAPVLLYQLFLQPH